MSPIFCYQWAMYENEEYAIYDATWRSMNFPQISNNLRIIFCSKYCNKIYNKLYLCNKTDKLHNYIG